MASEYTYLGLRGLVGHRWPVSINSFQPQQDGIQKVMGARVALEVTFNEFSPQYEGEVMDIISVDVHSAEDGEIVLQADYDYRL